MNMITRVAYDKLIRGESLTKKERKFVLASVGDNGSPEPTVLNQEQQNVLHLIQKIWKLAPSLRFLQLIGNCLGPVKPSDIYFVEDFKFMGCLEYTYAQHLLEEQPKPLPSNQIEYPEGEPK